LEARRRDADRGGGPIRATPITLLARRNAKAWASFAQAPDAAQLRYKPRAVLEFLRERGASFFDDIAEGIRLLPVEVEESLAELVALGLVNSDSFGGLRALLSPPAGGRRRRLSMFGMADAGRWASVGVSVPEAQRPGGAGRTPEAIEQVVRTLLRRWGVIFWKLLAREADWLPSWRDLLMCCRRLEARGEIRGGRFVAGFAGEQYASLDAVGALREVRRRPAAGQYLSLSGADPLNLLGIVTPGARLPSLKGNRLLYRDGVPVAIMAGGTVAFLADMDPKEQWQAQNALLRRTLPDALIESSSNRSSVEPPPRA